MPYIFCFYFMQSRCRNISQQDFVPRCSQYMAIFAYHIQLPIINMRYLIFSEKHVYPNHADNRVPGSWLAYRRWLSPSFQQLNCAAIVKWQEEQKVKIILLPFWSITIHKPFSNEIIHFLRKSWILLPYGTYSWYSIDNTYHNLLS